MKKTYSQITPDLNQVIVEHDDGTRLSFLNRVLQMETNEKFMAARGPVHGSCLLIIVDYAYYHVNSPEISDWIRQFDGAVRQEGMVITFDDDADRTAFVLRWG
jgi:hypothetical protein